MPSPYNFSPTIIFAPFLNFSKPVLQSHGAGRPNNLSLRAGSRPLQSLTSAGYLLSIMRSSTFAIAFLAAIAATPGFASPIHAGEIGSLVTRETNIDSREVSHINTQAKREIVKDFLRRALDGGEESTLLAREIVDILERHAPPDSPGKSPKDDDHQEKNSSDHELSERYYEDLSERDPDDENLLARDENDLFSREGSSSSLERRTPAKWPSLRLPSFSRLPTISYPKFNAVPVHIPIPRPHFNVPSFPSLPSFRPPRINSQQALTHLNTATELLGAGTQAASSLGGFRAAFQDATARHPTGAGMNSALPVDAGYGAPTGDGFGGTPVGDTGSLDPSLPPSLPPPQQPLVRRIDDDLVARSLEELD